MNTHIAILGAGESGVGAALLCQAKGLVPFVSDFGAIQPVYKEQLQQAGIDFEEGGHTIERLLACHEVVKSPGIPDSSAVVKACKEAGLAIISELELAARYTSARFICITGTNGKTTTTLLTYHLLKNAGLRVALAGNIGQSLAAKVIADEHDYYVVEVSSFQLDNMYDFRAYISILTNITPDHLDRYEYKIEKYAASKMRITQNQTAADFFIYNADDTITRQTLQNHTINATSLPFSLQQNLEPGISQTDNFVQVNLPGKQVKVSCAGSVLLGKHNQYNTMAAVAAAVLTGLEPQQIEAALGTFQNAAHRLEPVAEIDGVQYINDSKATNVEAVWYALDGIEKPIVWIAGGVDKGNDYSTLDILALNKVKALICLGKDNAKLLKAFAGIIAVIHEADEMQKAVELARGCATPGDVVLLSPACASFDLFRNYEHRGECFKTAVHRLARNEKQP